MANRVPLVLDSNGNIQQLQSADVLQVTELLIGPPGTQAATLTFLSPAGFWFDLPTSGPSAIGTGGAGNNAWLGYVSGPGDWCTDSLIGDLAYRNLGGRLLWGTSTGNSQMALTTTGLTISTPTNVTGAFSVQTMAAGDSSLNAANTAFVTTAIAKAVSVLQDFSGNVSVTSGTTLTPYGTAAPLITGGTQLWSQTLTPPAVTSSFEICFSGMVDSSTNSRGITVSLFRGNTLIGFTTNWITTNNQPQNFSMRISDVPGVTTPVTYTCRIGISTAATWYVGRGATGTMGGVNNTGWSIREVL